MDRKWHSNQCPDCKRVPTRDAAGNISCVCTGKKWYIDLSVEGTAEEQAIFKANGFRKEKDVAGNVYYAHDSGIGDIITLYSDGTWHSDKAGKESTIEEYLQSLKARVQAFTAV